MRGAILVFFPTLNNPLGGPGADNLFYYKLSKHTQTHTYSSLHAWEISAESVASSQCWSCIHGWLKSTQVSRKCMFLRLGLELANLSSHPWQRQLETAPHLLWWLWNFEHHFCGSQHAYWEHQYHFSEHHSRQHRQGDHYNNLLGYRSANRVQIKEKPLFLKMDLQVDSSGLDDLQWR